MLRVIERNTFEEKFKVMGFAVNQRKGRKPVKIIALHIKNTMARPPIYDGANLKKLATASTGNSVGVTEPSLILLLL